MADQAANRNRQIGRIKRAIYLAQWHLNRYRESGITDHRVTEAALHLEACELDLRELEAEREE